ncbi:hypothetical protein E0Z10_g9956 [Xylaria hypoxylon]|uniref:PNPLA domain-containing protein n=1 Tax=Xylaria hypoxylon TaxID=37992 RepID=A0A4Z0YMC8_9PEZI|nr:hypothetical protein E0Z10_g9956 [Xylaria hypoxylon]
MASLLARSTSAALMFFPPKYVPELGRSFQDGGVLRNNPTIVGLSEFSALTRDTRPDLIINLGTGSEPKPERQARFWHDSWPARLVRAYMSLMQGQSTWNDAACLVKRESRHIGHYRLDIALESEACLDDVSAMPLLRSVVLEDTTLKETIEEIAERLFAVPHMQSKPQSLLRPLYLQHVSANRPSSGLPLLLRFAFP